MFSRERERERGRERACTKLKYSNIFYVTRKYFKYLPFVYITKIQVSLRVRNLIRVLLFPPEGTFNPRLPIECLSKAVVRLCRSKLFLCVNPESFVRLGPTLTTFFSLFLFDEGREDPNATISGPLSAHQRNAI